jgi:hypothetical protein
MQFVLTAAANRHPFPLKFNRPPLNPTQFKFTGAIKGRNIMVKSFPLGYAARAVTLGAKGRSAREIAAFALRYASVMLERLAAHVAAIEKAPAEVGYIHTTVEFYAEAGAAEGAIYADGRLIGFLPGVKRL